MKVFAIITAGLMAAGAGAYYLSSGSSCPSNGSCPVAMTGGCCSGDQEKPACCTTPCPACSADCLTCCDECEVCCTTGVQASVSASVSAKPACCAAGEAKVAAVKANCCTTGADCCISACCFGLEKAVAKPVADEDCCSICTSPVSVATSAALAGIGAK